eukprot:scaffold378198_cov41-Prasinocladus_malaysianus.AAC.1
MVGESDMLRQNRCVKEIELIQTIRLPGVVLSMLLVMIHFFIKLRQIHRYQFCVGFRAKTDDERGDTQQIRIGRCKQATNLKADHWVPAASRDVFLDTVSQLVASNRLTGLCL